MHTYFFFTKLNVWRVTHEILVNLQLYRWKHDFEELFPARIHLFIALFRVFQSIEDALTDEEKFFKQCYPDLASRNGVPYLAKALSTLLREHIRKNLPSRKVSTFLYNSTACGKKQTNMESCSGSRSKQNWKVSPLFEMFQDAVAREIEKSREVLTACGYTIKDERLALGSIISELSYSFSKMLDGIDVDVEATEL